MVEAPRILPIFKGYTVDERLQEFRKMIYGKKPEFIPFASKKGQRLLGEMSKSGEGIFGLDILGRISERIKNIGER
jgi:hypothetical protein